MTPTQRAAALRLIEFETLPRRLLDIACRVRVNECLFHDDEFVDDASHALKEAIDLLRELLAEPQGEPVAWFLGEPGNYREVESWAAGAFPVYTHPPQQRKPLSLLQIDRLDQQAINGGPDSQYAVRFARAIERAITGEPT